MKRFQYIIPFAIFAMLISSCKKDNSNDPPKEPLYRVKEIQNGTEQKLFSYDGENRVTRINFNGGSFRFTYSPTEIVSQIYSSNDVAQLQDKYVFTIADGRITSGRRYMSNGAIGREYTYQYDNQQRLATTVMSLKDFTGDEDENHHYQFMYDGQDNLQQVIYKKQIKAGSILENADSVSVSITCFAEKPFVNWKHLGFDFFGKTAGGIELQGLETIPFSFTFLEEIIPFEKAVKSIDTKKYKANLLNGEWSQASTNTFSFSDMDYQYNDAGMLENYKNSILKWETY